jgi:Cu(I)/Ag(I) efflux system membrane fusion protein
MPGERYQGKVEYVYPDVDPGTRTIKVRFSVDNPALKLRPGMVANVTVHGGPKREVLLVPSEAVIRTGARSVVIVDEGEGHFRAQEVATGLDSGDQTEISEGLRSGEKVVISGQFLIDSEASLKGSIARLERGATQQPAAQPDSEHVARGTVESVDPAAGKVVIAHGPVTSLDWPAMTMGFAVKDQALLERLAPGQEIEFRFAEGEGGYVIDEIRPAEEPKR